MWALRSAVEGIEQVVKLLLGYFPIEVPIYFSHKLVNLLLSSLALTFSYLALIYEDFDFGGFEHAIFVFVESLEYLIDCLFKLFVIHARFSLINFINKPFLVCFGDDFK